MPILIQHSGVAEVLQEGWCAFHHGRHRQQRVEPVAELPREGFADPIRRVPLSPIIGVLAVAEGAEGDNTGIQPGVAHVAHPAHLGTALRAGYLDRIDIGAVGGMVVQHVQAARGALLQLIVTADDLKIAALRALPDGQRQSPITLLADHPVVHVAQPVHLA